MTLKARKQEAELNKFQTPRDLSDDTLDVKGDNILEASVRVMKGRTIFIITVYS